MEKEIHQSIIALSEEANGEKALKILFVSAYFASAQNMHLDMFSCLFNDIEEELNTAVQMLKRQSLIDTILDRYSNKPAFFIKKNVQKEIRTFLKQNGKEKDVLTEAINLQTSHLLKDDIHPNYIDHSMSLLLYVRDYNELVNISIRLPILIVEALTGRNRLVEAFTFAKKALKFLEKTVGECHPGTLALQHGLAAVLDARGQHAKAIKVLQELNEKNLKDLPKKSIIKCLVLYAQELRELSKYEEALALYQILIGKRTVLDTFDCEIITAWHDYALVLSDMGRHSESIDILQDVLSKRKEVLSSADEYGLITRRNLANVFQAQGNYIQAMKQLKEALYEMKKHYGESHLQTLRVERDIGTLLLHAGDHKKALRKLEDVEKKFKQILPDSHPDILCTRANKIGSLMKLNEYNTALQISEDVYEAYKNIFGEKHNETLKVKLNMGDIFMYQGKRNEAVKIYQEVYEGFYDVFGPEHDRTVEAKALSRLMGCLPETSNLHLAAQNGDLNEIVILVGKNADVNEKDFAERRPLHYAASNGHINVAKYLLKMGAMYNAVDVGNLTAYQLASDKRIKNLLISINNLFKNVKRGMQVNIAGHTEFVNAKDKNGHCLLHWAACFSRKSVVQQLLKAGADPKCVSLKGNTPLHIASSKRNKEIIEILLQSVTGNDLSFLINSKTTEGCNTALHVAAKNNDFDVVRCLLMYGAIYDIKNKEGETPVHLSAEQTIRDLLSMIQDIFASVLKGKSEVIAQLKSLSIDKLPAVAKARNSQGHTLLQIAIMNKHRNIVRELLELLSNPAI